MKKDHPIENHSVLQNDDLSVISISHQAITSFVSGGLFVLAAVGIVRIALGTAMDMAMGMATSSAPKFLAMSAVALVLLCAFAFLLCVEAITRARATRQLLAARGWVKEKTK